MNTFPLNSSLTHTNTLIFLLSIYLIVALTPTGAFSPIFAETSSAKNFKYPLAFQKNEKAAHSSSSSRNDSASTAATTTTRTMAFTATKSNDGGINSSSSQIEVEETPQHSGQNWKEYPKDYNEIDDDDDHSTTPSPLFDYCTTVTNSNNKNNLNDLKSNKNTSSDSFWWSNEQYLSSLERYEEFISSQDSYIAPLIQEGLETLLQAYRLYGPSNVIGSFNGGKDAVVIMELMKAAHAKYYHDLISSSSDNDKKEEGDNDDDSPLVSNIKIIRPRMIYFNDKLEFPQVYDFVRNTVKKYDLDMIAFDTHISFVKGLDILVKHNNALSSSSLSSDAIPIPMSFVLGTRKADPNASGQGLFAPSSTWMPPFMRVNPVLNWTYGHTWHFLRLFKIPYCELYDRGYTSLGNVEDTLPCPALLKVKISEKDNITNNNDGQDDDDDDNDNSSCDYWPAYMLKDWNQERAGRVKKEKKKTSSSSSSKLSSQTGDQKNEANEKNDSNKLEDDVKNLNNKTESKSDLATNSTSNLPKNDVRIIKDGTEESVSSTTTASQRSVGLLIIGDEILKGLTIDSNSHAAAMALKSNNVPLAKVSVVSDDLYEIVQEIEYLTSLVDIVITSGGVGPTHDDVTIKSVGKALNSRMTFNKDMAELLQSKMKAKDGTNEKEELTEAQIKMSTLPECSKLRYLSSDENEWPVLQCQNVFILPGVPQFFQKKIELVANYLSTELERSVQFKVVLSIDENSIVPILNRVVSSHPNVSFGSYPFVNHPEYKTVVTLEGRKVEGGSAFNSKRYLFADADSGDDKKTFEEDEIELNVKLALADLVNGMPDGSVLRVDNNNDLMFV